MRNILVRVLVQHQLQAGLFPWGDQPDLLLWPSSCLCLQVSYKHAEGGFLQAGLGVEGTTDTRVRDDGGEDSGAVNQGSSPGALPEMDEIEGVYRRESGGKNLSMWEESGESWGGKQGRNDCHSRAKR